MPDLTAAQVIAEELADRGAYDCARVPEAWGYGTMELDDFTAMDTAAVTDHIMAALAAAGFAVVKLPAADVWSTCEVYVDDLECGVLWGNEGFAPDEARALAAALLAAANAAESAS